MRSRLGRLALILALAVPVLAGRADAAPSDCTIWWTGAAGGVQWSTTANWSTSADGTAPARLPEATDVVCSAVSPAVIWVTDSDVQVAGIDLQPNSALVVRPGASLSLLDATKPARMDGLNMPSGGTLTTAGPLTLDLLDLSGTVIGDVTTTRLLGAHGTVDGDLTLPADAVTAVLLDTPGRVGDFTVTGTAAVDGTLSYPPGTYDEGIGTSRPVFTAGAVTGQFDAMGSYPQIGGNRFLDDVYTDTSVSLVVKPLPLFTIGDSPDVDESAGTATITIERQNAMDQDVWVRYETVDDTAVTGVDYTAVSGTVGFHPGENSKTITVPILDDSDIAPMVQFKVHLYEPFNGVIAEETNNAAVRILNDDPPVIESIEGGPVRQGSTNQLLTLHGLGLGSTTDLVFARPGLAVVNGTLRVVDDTTVTVRVSAKSGMRTGPIGTTLYADAGETTCADCLNVVSRPIVTSVSPAVLGAGASRRWVTVSGTGFLEGAAVTIAGAVVHETTFVSPNELQVNVSVPSTRLPGVASLRVVNPDGGRHTCNTCASFVGGPRLDPANALAVRRSSTRTVHLLGSGFVDGLTLSAPPGVTFTDLVVTPSEVTATMTVAATTRLAPDQKVTVTNPASAGWGSTFGTFLTVCTRTAPSCGS